MIIRKIPSCFLKIAAVVAFVLLCAGTSVAAERWLIFVWGDDADEFAKFKAFCMDRGMTPSEILEAHGYTEGELPSEGKVLLVPASRSDLLVTWVEIQNRTGGAGLPITVRLHDIPSILQETQEDVSAEETAVPEPELDHLPESELYAQHPQTEPELDDLQEPAHDAIQEPEPDMPQRRRSAAEMEIEALLAQIDRTPLVTIELHNVPVRREQEPAPPRLTVEEARGRMIWPVNGRVSSGFGRRGRRGFHHGIDIPMPARTPILAALDGVVIDTATYRDRRFRGYGNVVLIYHGNGLVTLYSHASEIIVRRGQQVRQGDVIALVGRTGRATANHLHFEVRVNGRAVDPMPFLARR